MFSIFHVFPTKLLFIIYAKGAFFLLLSRYAHTILSPSVLTFLLLWLLLMFCDKELFWQDLNIFGDSFWEIIKQTKQKPKKRRHSVNPVEKKTAYAG